MTTDDIAKGQARAGLSGGFWRRFLAVVLDWLVIGLLVTGAVVVAYPATDGAVRMSQPPLRFAVCQPSTIPAGFDPAMAIPGVDPALQARIMGDPADFRPNQITECVVSLFGLETDRQRTISQVRQEGNVTRSTSYNVPVDASGAVVSPLYLDNAIGPAMLILLALMEGLFGVSFGKAVTGLRVRARDADGRRASFAGGLVRNLLIYGPFAAFSLFSLATVVGWIPGGLPSMIAGGALMVLMLGWLIALLVGLIRGRPDPFWDVWSGTRVVRR